jgi:hypothetical protein
VRARDRLAKAGELQEVAIKIIRNNETMYVASMISLQCHTAALTVSYLNVLLLQQLSGDGTRLFSACCVCSGLVLVQTMCRLCP